MEVRGPSTGPMTAAADAVAPPAGADDGDAGAETDTGLDELLEVEPDPGSLADPGPPPLDGVADVPARAAAQIPAGDAGGGSAPLWGS